MRPPKSEALIEKVMANAHECAGCLIWDGCVNSAGVPVCRHDGSNVMPVRRHLWVAMGRKLDKRAILTSCKEPLCVEPTHLVQENRGLPVGRKHTIAHRKAMSKARRERSLLTLVDVDAIRESEDRTAVLGERYGLSLSQILNIKKGACWADLNSPFWGMQA